MTIFDAPPIKPPWKYRRLAIAVGAAVVIAAITIAVLLRFHTERNTVRQFMNAVAESNFQQAYQVWKPSPSYTFQDFMQDWGPDGYYGPVKSFRIDNHLTQKQGTVVSITVDVSPYRPFPADDDPIKASKTKQVRLWVQFKDESISFPPI
ncbi:MAG TPA: hypothetical protein VN727_00120 [Candidatus Binatia bacterium]|jgi:hypothetical protein|nr:hypothetical protein [Candidatus Binatia bacterium]